MRIRALGTFAVLDTAGQAVPLGARRASLLLARLSLSPQKVVPADVLLEDVWEGHPPQGGAQTLRRLAARTRERLAEHGLRAGPRAEGGGYLLDLPPQEVDSCRFEHLAAEGTRLLRAGAVRSALAPLEEALRLWHGAPYGGIRADFADREVTRLEAVHLRAVEDRLHALAGTGETTSILPELHEHCLARPMSERGHALLIRTLARTGETGAALAAYERLRESLAKELGTTPSPGLRTLHESLLHGSPGPRPRPVRSYLTRLYGRDHELAALEELSGRTRMVCLVGPGGVGKTRLAAEHADRTSTGNGARGAGRRTGETAGAPRQVCLVDLSPLRTGDSPADAVAASLGTAGPGVVGLGGPGGETLQHLVAALSARPTLLLLDSCEHLAASVAQLAGHLLGACPGLSVLATSREPLGVAGEAVLRVDPLATSGPSSEAVAMFEDIASLARPGLRLGPAEQTAVVRICRRLDGLPLAIELAASQVRSMPVEEVASHLDDRFRLLEGVRRDGDRRHQSLSALMDWTWNLLSEAEQRLAARLALLPGGATEAAATALLDGDAAEAPFLLSSLVDKSLLHPEVPGSGADQDGKVAQQGTASRYHLLETPRLYLASRLHAVGDEAAAAEAVEGYLTRLATEASSMLLGRDQGQGLALLDAESTNLAAALHRMLERDDVRAAATLGTALVYYWLIRGRYNDLERWADALHEAPAGLAPLAQAVASAIRPVIPHRDSAAGTTEAPGRGTVPGDMPAEPLDEAVLSAFPPLVGITAKLCVAHGEHSRARADAAVATSHPDPRVRAAGTAARALVDEACGDVAAAEAGTAEALEQFRQVGDLWACAQMSTALAGFCSLRGDVGSAVSRLRAVVDLERSLGLYETVPVTLAHLGRQLLRAKEYAQAAAAFHEALSTGAQSPGTDGDSPAGSGPGREVRVLCLAGLARAALGSNETTRSRRLLAEARQLLSAPLADEDYLSTTVLHEEAALALHTGDVARARELAGQAWQAARRLADAGTQAEAAELVAQTLLRSGQTQDASRMLDTAEAIRGW